MERSDGGSFRISIVAHATLLVEAGGERVLVDPVLGPTFAAGSIGFTPAREIDLSLMPAPTALVITHCHIDHYDPPSLVHLPKHVPILIPHDDWIEDQLRTLGFLAVRRVGPWEEVELGNLRIVATPSNFEMVEMGILFEAGGRTFWDMSDSLVDAKIAERVRTRFGAIDVIGAKFQPGNVLVGYQHSLGSTFDEKAAVATWLNAACACDPRLIFPWASGVSFQGAHAWANRIAFPFTAEEIAKLVDGALEGRRGRATTVGPGDVLEITSDGVTQARGRAPFVRALSGESIDWEPVDLQTLPGVRSEERAPLRAALARHLGTEFLPWLVDHIEGGGVFANFRRLEIRWQLAVHLGDGERAVHHVDFGRAPLEIVEGPGRHPNYFVHLSGRALQRIFDGEAGTEQLWLCGDWRVHEKVLLVDRGVGIWAPKQQGWDLIERLPEPLAFSMRKTIIAPVHRLRGSGIEP